MFSAFSKRSHLLALVAVTFLGTVPVCSAQSPEAMATAHRWVGAKFLGEVTPNPAESYLLVYTQSGPVTKNEVARPSFPNRKSGIFARPALFLGRQSARGACRAGQEFRGRGGCGQQRHRLLLERRPGSGGGLRRRRRQDAFPQSRFCTRAWRAFPSKWTLAMPRSLTSKSRTGAGEWSLAIILTRPIGPTRA